MGRLTDQQLLDRFRMGDEYALEVIFERSEEKVFHFLMVNLRDHHQAEDALQETFIKALVGSESVIGERFRGWLFTVAYREAMLIKRKQKRRAATAGEPMLAVADPSPSGPE